MKRMLSAVVAALLLAAACAAAAQDPTPAPVPGPGPGRGGPAMQAMRQACAADAVKLCPDKTGPDRRQCMRDHAADLSDGCKSAIAEMRKQMPMQ